MKEKVAILLGILLFLSVLHISVSEPQEIKFSHINGYCVIESDLQQLLKPGYPILPYETKSYVFPAGTKIKDIKIWAEGINKIKIKEKILPASWPAAANGEEEIKEGKIYEENRYYPYTWYDYSIKMGIKNGKHVIFLNLYLYKYRYNPIKNEIMYANDFKIDLKYDLPSRPLFTASNYDLLIIAPSDWMDALQTFVQHKEMEGIKTKLVSIEDAEKMNGNDDAEKIKYFIKDEIEKDGIRYVMLVGDASIFPVRYSHVYDGEEDKFVSDLYYADIYAADGSFSSWDSNHDGIYGEYKYHGKNDVVDLMPDVYVGRLACRSKAELENAISKIIEYESTAYEQPWTSRVAVAGGDSHDDNDGIYEGEQIKNKSISYLSGYSIDKLYVSSNTLSKSSIISEFNKGQLLFNFAGHGNRLSWATHPPHDFNTWIGFSIGDIYSMKNGNNLPVVILNACETGQFDKGTCIAWYLVAAPNKGSISTFAATALSWEYTGKYCDKGLSGYMDVLFCKHFKKGNYLGDIFYSAKESYIKSVFQKTEYDYKVIEEWELFGDPTLIVGGYSESEKPIVSIKSPEDGYLYFANTPIMQTFSGKTIVIGKIDVEVNAYNVNKVEFYFDGKLKYTDTTPPYEWLCNETAFFSHTIKVVGYGENDKAEDTKNILIFNI